MKRRKASLGTVTSNRPNDHGGAVSAHPGKIDRMKGGKPDGGTGPSHPDHLPGKGRRR